ncbi:MAG TPA: tetratricopeptide repeat protein [Tepidisphaeraceae bacterium]|nr:tetratricopeptide repeat protein [Tepidisphaeraceae bacterium]
MNRFSSFVLGITILCGAGCASHQQSSTSKVATVAPPSRATPEVETPLPVEATLSLDQLDPKLQLGVPQTQATDDVPPAKAVDLYAQARVALLNEDPASALHFLEEAVSLDPRSYELHFELGQLYQRQPSSDQQAIAEFEKAGAIEPDHLELQLNLGRQYFEKAQYVSAIRHLRLALLTHQYLADDPRDPIADFFLGNALSHAGYDTASLEIYRRLVSRLQSPNMAMRMSGEADVLMDHLGALHGEIGDLLLKLRRAKEGEAEYAEALKIDPDDFDLREHIVRAQLVEKKWALAQQDALDSVMRFRASAQSLRLLREAYRASGEENRLADVLANTYQNQLSNRSLLYALADLLHQQHEDAKADQVLAKAQETNPSDISIIRRRMVIFEDRGDMIGAAKLLIAAAAADADLNEELGPLWNELIHPSDHGNLLLSQLSQIEVPSSQQAVKLVWLARIARVWHREAIAQSARQQALSIQPICRQAYRDEIDNIGELPQIPREQDDATAQLLADRAATAGDAALAAELKGLWLSRREHPAEAADALAKAIAQGDRSVETILAHAAALRASGDLKAFESLLWKLMSDRPSFSLPYLELYNYYLGLKMDQQADRVLAQWFESDPGNPSALELQAQSDIEAGRESGGEAILSRIVLQDSTDTDILEPAGLMYAQAHHLDRFAQLLEQRQKLHPRSWPANMVLLDTYIQLGRNEDAKKLADATRSLWASDPDALYGLTAVYSNIGQRAVTEEVLSQILKLDPKHAGAANDLGFAWADAGVNLNKAESLIRQAVDQEPQNASFLDSLGWVLYKRGEFSQARTFLDRAVGPESSEGDPNPEILNHRGDVFYRLGDKTSAKRDWTRATKWIKDKKQDDGDLKTLYRAMQGKLEQLDADKPVGVAPVIGKNAK